MEKSDRETIYILSSHLQQLKNECSKYRRDIQLLTKFLTETSDFPSWFTMESMKEERKRVDLSPDVNNYSRLRNP